MIQLVHSADIDQQASIWAERQLDGLSEEQAHLLRQWLRASPAHRSAFAQARARCQQLAQVVEALQAKAAGQSLPVRAAIALDAPQQPLWRRAPLARVASLLVAGAALMMLLMQPDLRTGVGEQQTHLLADGSRLTLNSATRVNLVFTEQERRVELLSGELFVEVAKNPARPFIVATEQGDARAVGTAFGVRTYGDATSVLVTEGLVDVSAAAAPAKRLAAQQSIRVGEQLGLVTERSAEDVRKALSWREQRLYFANVALAEFVEEMNRHSYQRLVIADADLSAVRVGGAFAIGDTPGAVTMLEAGFPIKAVQITPLLTLLYRDTDPAH
ncbi:FecR domain-containing protein [Simiduia sp. 21SJ11W-1]|uniref:FecR family protein n=1 Tax=Simiduia sp. 21SJ11W-1 TaxID=2909669 RepID=UPI0020A14FD7|nr:FecR domain-containing protein [Simiduia sp. 21SJ11W-1]UTA46921.1 FecR domain-containing protein [Simiduia sp. 21SJ11W-1]